jgi:hypothetical protein
MPDFKIHNDDCDELLVNGVCHRCGFAPDSQSIAWVSVLESRHDLRERARKAEKDALDARCTIERLEVRQQELLELVARLSQSTPLASEMEGWESARRALVAEVGTLRARVAELERRMPVGATFVTALVPNAATATDRVRPSCGVCLDGAAPCPVVDPPGVTQWTCLACGKIVGRVA